MEKYKLKNIIATEQEDIINNADQCSETPSPPIVRDYQKTIYTQCLAMLEKNHRLYLELATGGGKSFIIYIILSILRPDVVVMFSPRKNINKQNSSSKYTSYLKDEYLVYNCSERKDFDSFKAECKHKKMIIVACPQSSYEKVFGFLKGSKNVFIWFDEAHHTVEHWIHKKDKHIMFLLNDTTTIQNRIFSSASPNKRNVETNPGYFGELYAPIKVKHLIRSSWLCSIVPRIFSLNKNNIDICNYNLDHFEKYERHYGFSFHNMCDSAYALFMTHYIKYMNKETTIRPYLLVGKDYKTAQRIEPQYRDINHFEKHVHSMAYVVQQYSLGYDFKGIDYIIFSDPKMSYSDIIQCIGRGIRPDGLGVHDKNLNKTLTIMLPVYIDIDIHTDFNRIEQALRYLVHDIDIPFDQIHYDFKETDGDKKRLGKKYDGHEDMKSVLLDLLRGGKYSTWKESDFVELLINNHIHCRTQYNAYIKSRHELSLPDDPFRCFTDFTWEQTYVESPYYSREECKQKIYELNVDLDDYEEPEQYLHSLDPNIPPICLFKFYGGHNNHEYY